MSLGEFIRNYQDWIAVIVAFAGVITLFIKNWQDSKKTSDKVDGSTSTLSKEHKGIKEILSKEHESIEKSLSRENIMLQNEVKETKQLAIYLKEQSLLEHGKNIELSKKEIDIKNTIDHIVAISQLVVELKGQVSTLQEKNIQLASQLSYYKSKEQERTSHSNYE